MKTNIVTWLVAGLLLAACSTTDRYNAISSACQTYAIALNTAAALNKAGKIGTDKQAAIDATIEPARAVCSGQTPSTDSAAAQKVADLVIAVLNAQGATP